MAPWPGSEFPQASLPQRVLSFTLSRPCLFVTQTFAKTIFGFFFFLKELEESFMGMHEIPGITLEEKCGAFCSVWGQWMGRGKKGKCLEISLTQSSWRRIRSLAELTNALPPGSSNSRNIAWGVQTHVHLELLPRMSTKALFVTTESWPYQ